MSPVPLGYSAPNNPYQGELVITGEPSMKPYDQVFLYDSYNDMSGPIEVEQVTHIFSQETGFVTVITPDLVVQTNEYLSMSLVDSFLPISPKNFFCESFIRGVRPGTETFSSNAPRGSAHPFFDLV